jgi:NAD(P)-dependent dehydrogenase (short-subunit alcohol dehydrogenase family)
MPRNARRFDGKAVIVTGAAGGIGRAYAAAFAQEGASVCVADVKADEGERLAAGIAEAGGTAVAVHTDVSDEQSTKALAAATLEAFGRIDVLVNNAALFGDADLSWDVYTGPMEYWDRSMAVNVRSIVLCTRAVVPTMIEQGGGVIVNQSSGAAYTNGSLYGMSKLAVLSLTMGFARDLGKHNIRVNAIAPGPTDTEAYRRRNVDTGNEAAFISRLALQRKGRPEDLAAGLLYLASDDAAWVTGEVLSIDGGFSMRI